MKKLLLILSLVGTFNSPVSAGDKHHESKDCTCLFCVCQDCKCSVKPSTDQKTTPFKVKIEGKEYYTGRKIPNSLDSKIKAEIKQKYGVEVKAVQDQLPKRIWVEDVHQPGLWYYGYYVPVGTSYEFRYSRREYKSALSNFNSLYSVQHKYDVKTDKRPPVKVVYESAY